MSKDDDAWHDAMYNNRALVPEHGDHFRRWTEDSAQVLRAHPSELDIRYGDGPGEQLDIFPAEQASAPVVVFIHGGYWRSLDKRDFAFIAPAFTRTGACVVVPNYALCPAVTIPQITLQMVQALAWVFRNIDRHGGDPSRITVIGHSAGGHLAAMVLACLWRTVGRDLPPHLVRNAMSISGLYDLHPIMRTPFLQESLRLTPADARRASPALLPAPKHGALYSVVGGQESEEFLRQNALIRGAWGNLRVPVCAVAPGLNHFSVVQGLVQPEHSLHQLAQELVAA